MNSLFNPRLYWSLGVFGVFVYRDGGCFAYSLLYSIQCDVFFKKCFYY